MRTVAAFTDTYLPTVNGVTYTVSTWRDRWHRRGGWMPVVYPDDTSYEPAVGEYPVPSIPFPFYRGFRFGWPRLPEPVVDVSPAVVHAHTPFTLGLAARRLARRLDVPFVASYHTPAREYAAYISDAFAGGVRHAADRYERWFFGEADVVIAPSAAAAAAIESHGTPVRVVSNGVDTDRFRPQPADRVAAFRARHDLPAGPLVGYTGRHGYEKRLADLLAATSDIEATVVLAGDGPARPALERQAADRDDVRFLGFIDREELPAFYAVLDVFAFPSPVETQGLVALEAIACGTPVVGVDSGALAETVTDGETGYHYVLDDRAGFTAAIERALADRDRLHEACLDRREEIDVERSIDGIQDVYDAVCGETPSTVVRRPGR